MEKYRYVLNLEVGEIDYYYLGLFNVDWNCCV